MNNEQQIESRDKNSNKIYFLIAVIIVLLGTITYLYFKNEKTKANIVVVTDEKIRMQADIDKIELQLDSANNVTVKLSEEMKVNQEQAHQKISELRLALKKGKLTSAQLVAAQSEIKKLRAFVAQYTAQIDELKNQNAALTTERNVLKTRVDSVSEKAGVLQKQNEDLNNKVTVAAALKTGNVDVVAIKVRRNGKESNVEKAKTASKLRLNFTVVNNPLAAAGMHDVFICITGPDDKVISGDNIQFTANGTQFQSTFKTSIEFSNEGKAYSIDWVNPEKFQKGTYKVVLYADSYTMGQGSVDLK